MAFMQDDSFRIFQLAAQGFCCSQIIVMLMLEREGKENPDLIRAMNGMCGGVGLSGKSCGILIGGICVLGLYGGRGQEQEPRKENYSTMLQAFEGWFAETFGHTDCIDIVGYQVVDSATGLESYPVKCGENLLKSYQQLENILLEYGYEPGYREEA